VSLLALCLQSAGVGLLAGFGDSLGSEMEANLLQLLGPETPPHWDWMGCANSGRQKLHRLRVESAEEPSSLASCIEETVAQRLSLLNNTSSNTTAFRFEEVLLVTNFMSQHSVWLMTLADIRRHLLLQALQHQRLAQRLLTRFGLRYRRVFFSAVAVHGFRAGGLTPARQLWLNRQAAELLGAAGWQLLDGE